MEQFQSALDAISLKILKLDQSKQRPVSTNRGTMNMDKFSAMMIKELSPFAVEHPIVWKTLHNIPQLEKLIYEYAEKKKILFGGTVQMEIPPEMRDLKLNLNLCAKGRDDKFFLTHADETVSKVSGEIFLLINQISPLEAAADARKVIPEYMPRGEKGVTEIENDGKTETVFNMYTPPRWTGVKKKLPDSLPLLFTKLVNHLFPLIEEREYFYSWLYDSLFSRSFVFLILCGAPGTGKNRLKIVLRALHGHVNTIDGKKSTLVERFNSQLGEATLAWFDELHYDTEMENTMKELQNDSISIERKGVDATRATKIHSSIVISNNKPRDNYIAFDARKFVPLVITPHRLEIGMKSHEIDELTKKVEDQSSETFDVDFIAQIARYIKRRGRSKKWPNLEYRGPMFWALAHTSMARWQKRAVMLLLEPESRNQRMGYDEAKKAHLWSVLQSKSQKKNGDRSLQFPDFTSVRAFFEVFRDGKGRKAFETEPIKGNILGDFYVKSIYKHLEIITESSVVEERSRQNAKGKKEIYDL